MVAISRSGIKSAILAAGVLSSAQSAILAAGVLESFIGIFLFVSCCTVSRGSWS